jgi:peptidyl-dipeptidase Dcp
MITLSASQLAPHLSHALNSPNPSPAPPAIVTDMTPTDASDATTPPPRKNPLLTPSPLPYHLPPFASITADDYQEAFEVGMRERMEQVRAIADSVEPPTFANTIAALERSGATLTRARGAFSVVVAADPDERLLAIEGAINTALVAHRDAVAQDRGLFARIDALYQDRGSLGLDAEALRVLERYHVDAVRAGAALSAEDQGRLRLLNAELAALSTAFKQNAVVDAQASAVFVDDAALLDGLSAAAVVAAAGNAVALGRPGEYALLLKNYTEQPELALLRSRSLRERLYRASVSRGLEGTNRDVVPRIARLRAEHAALLGFSTHADYQVAAQTAGSVGAVEGMFARVVGPAVANARAEAVVLASLASRDGHDLEPWDWSSYAQQVRRARYDFDSSLLRDYFSLERVLVDGVFFAASRLYGLSFSARPDLVGHHPDVLVFEVFDRDGSPLGLFLGDFFARTGKRGGAWMNSIVVQSRLLDSRPVVVVSSQVAKPRDGGPALLSPDEVRTLFHEFGHALHGLLSDVTFPRVAGTSVPRDFAEYPSQVNEMWMYHPEVLANYARHHETGAPVPEALVAAMRAAASFGQGFKTVEQVAASLLDWAWHTLPGDSLDAAAAAMPGDLDIEAFEAAALEKAGIGFPLIAPRYRSAYFVHSFSHGYSAGYYSYTWSEILDADTVEWFEENGGMTRENGDAFRGTLLSKGDSVDPMEAFAALRGRAPRIEPLLARRGLLADTA